MATGRRDRRHTRRGDHTRTLELKPRRGARHGTKQCWTQEILVSAMHHKVKSITRRTSLATVYRHGKTIVLQNLPSYTRVENVSGSCFAEDRFT